jgi:hypothetical protein
MQCNSNDFDPVPPPPEKEILIQTIKRIEENEQIIDNKIDLTYQNIERVSIKSHITKIEEEEKEMINN